MPVEFFPVYRNILFISFLIGRPGGWGGILPFGVKPKSFRMLWGFGLISILKVYLNMLSTRLTKKNTFQPTSRVLIGPFRLTKVNTETATEPQYDFKTVSMFCWFPVWWPTQW